MSHRVLASSILALVGLGISGCAGADDTDGDPTESPPWQSESAVDDMESTPEEAAIAAFEAYWQAIDEAGAIPDPDHEALENTSSDQALDGAVAMVQEQVDDGTRVDGLITLTDTTVVEQTPQDEPTEIVVEACVDNSTAVIVDAESGIPVADAAYGRRQARAVVLLNDDGWSVRAIHTQELGTC